MMALIAGAAALLSQAQADRAAPVARWWLRVAPGHCSLERRGVTPASALSIDTTPGSDFYRVAITGGEVGRPGFKPATLTFAPSRKTLKGPATVATLPDGTAVIWMQGIPPAVLDDLADAADVTLAAQDSLRTVAVTDAGKAVEGLRRCIADQLVEWGADAAQFAPGGRLPIALKNRDAWLSDWHLLAIAGKIGRPTIDDDFRIAVSPAGVVDQCRAVADDTEAELQKGICAAVMNKRLFIPAMNAAGNPVRGVATFHVALMRHPAG